ncbi:MAG: glycosyltransferase family 4 protein [Thermodesulfobacteriota bacterium]
MKTIALALDHFSRYAGGAESYAVSLAQTLVRSGWAVHLFGRSWEGEPQEAVFHRLTVPRWWPEWARLMGFALKHRRAIRSGGFDVILGFGNTIHMNVYQSHGGVHWESTKRKLFAEPNPLLRLVNRVVYRISPKQWVRHWIESAPFRLYPPPKIIAISPMIKEDFIRTFGIDAGRVALVYNGVDTDRYHPGLRQSRRGSFRQTLGIDPETVVFLFASYELRKKGILPLIEAAGLLKSRVGETFRVIVAGGRPSPRQSKRIAKLRLEGTILFLGPVRNMEECFADSDVFVLPTYYDACSLVIFEAMASGLPCITTQFNGAAGIISEGGDGFILKHPPGVEDLADKMALLLDRTRRESMGQAAAETARGYTIHQNHQAVLKILDEVAETVRKGPAI